MEMKATDDQIRLFSEAIKALSRFADIIKPDQIYYEVNKLIHRLWELDPNEP